MRSDDNPTTLLDGRLEPLMAWERNLRPSSSPSLFPVTAGVLVVLLAVVGGGACWSSGAFHGSAAETAQQLAPNAASANPSKTPIVSTAPGQPAAAAVQPGQTVTKCTTRQGRAIYSDGACPEGTVTGAIEIHPEANIADGLSPAARAASLRSNAEVSQQLVMRERQVAQNVEQGAGECASLNTAILQLDAAARQPLSAYQQDRIREDRRRLRDRQFALRCQ